MTIEKAVNVLKMNRDLCRFNPDTGEKTPLNKECAELADAIDTVIPFIESLCWAPVTERLPEENGKYLDVTRWTLIPTFPY